MGMMTTISQLNPEIRNNVINNTSYPIYLDDSLDGYTGQNRITGNTGSGNTNNYIRLEKYLVGNVRLGTANSFEWVFNAGAYVSSGAVWELEPDEVIKFLRSYSSSYRLTVHGTLLADTTADHPVVFTSFQDDAYGYSLGTQAPATGDWSGIEIASDGTAVFDYAVVRYVGYEALIEVNSGGSLTLTNSTLEHGSSYGVYVNGVEEQSLIGNTINDCGSYGIYIHGNDDDDIPINPEIRNNVINNTSYPIYLDDSLDGYNRTKPHHRKYRVWKHQQLHPIGKVPGWKCPVRNSQ